MAGYVPQTSDPDRTVPLRTRTLVVCLSLISPLGLLGCAAKPAQVPVTAGPPDAAGPLDARNRTDLAALAALPSARRNAYLQQHPDVVQRIYAGRDQDAKVRFAKLMQQR